MSFCKLTIMSTSRCQAFVERKARARAMSSSSAFCRRPGPCRPSAARSAAARGRRRRRSSGPPASRWRLAQQRDLRLEAGDLVLQARDFLFQRGAVFRHRLTGPADGMRTAKGDLPGLIVEPQEAVIDALEDKAAAIRRRGAARAGARRFRQRRRRGLPVRRGGLRGRRRRDCRRVALAAVTAPARAQRRMPAWRRRRASVCA